MTNLSPITPDTSAALMQASQGQATEAAKTLRSSLDIKKAEEAAQEFEAVFIAEMMKPMFEGISTEAPFGGGKGEEVFRSLLLQEYGKVISQTGGLGIADTVKEQMIQLQAQVDSGSEYAIIE